MTACNLSSELQISRRRPFRRSRRKPVSRLHHRLCVSALLRRHSLLPPFLSSQCCRSDSIDPTALVGAGTQAVPRREICELCSFAGGRPFRRICRICYGPQHLLNAWKLCKHCWSNPGPPAVGSHFAVRLQQTLERYCPVVPMLSVSQTDFVLVSIYIFIPSLCFFLEVKGVFMSGAKPIMSEHAHYLSCHALNLFAIISEHAHVPWKIPDKKNETKKKPFQLRVWVNLVSIFRCSSSTANPVYERRVTSIVLVCSLSSHRHSYTSYL